MDDPKNKTKFNPLTSKQRITNTTKSAIDFTLVSIILIYNYPCHLNKTLEY